MLSSKTGSTRRLPANDARIDRTKRKRFWATPGPLRVLREIALHGVAIAGAWIVWPVWLAVVATITVIAALAVGIPRTKWLLRGAPMAAG